MFHSFRTLSLGFAALFAFHHTAQAQSNNITATNYLFPVMEYLEPPRDLTGTPCMDHADPPPPALIAFKMLSPR